MDKTVPSFLQALLEDGGQGVIRLQEKGHRLAGQCELALSTRGLQTLREPAMPECQWLLEWMHAFGFEFVCYCHGMEAAPAKAYVRQRGARAGYTWGKHPSSDRHTHDCPLFHIPSISRGGPGILPRHSRDHWSPDSPLNLQGLTHKYWRERLATFQRALIREANLLYWDRQAIKHYRPATLCEAARAFRAECDQPLDRSRFTATASYWLDRQRHLKGNIPMYATLVAKVELRNDGFWLESENNGRLWQAAEVTSMADSATEFTGEQPYMITLAALRRPGEEALRVVAIAQPLCSERVWLPVRSSEERRRVREWISVALRDRGRQQLFIQAPAELSGGMVFGKEGECGSRHEVLPPESPKKDLYRLFAQNRNGSG